MTASDFLDARVARPDLPPSEWSKISVILDHEGVWEWARGTSRKRLSASCVRLRSCWRGAGRQRMRVGGRSEEHTSELQSLMRISYAVFCLKKKNKQNDTKIETCNYQDYREEREDQ